MAHVKKFVHKKVRNAIRHNQRNIERPSNEDIDKSLSNLNYTLHPKRKGGDYHYYMQRKRELYCYERADVITLAGWIITLPKELRQPEQQNEFFKACYDFLEDRYGVENVIQASVHYDEGKRAKVKDEHGKYVRDDNGKIKTKLLVGQPHLHFCFIPVVKIDPDKINRKGSKSGKRFSYHEEMSYYDEKICAKEVLTRHELRTFHSDLAEYLKRNNIAGAVITGTTKGKGYTVEQLKEKTQMQLELEELRLQLKELTIDKEKGWGVIFKELKREREKEFETIL